MISAHKFDLEELKNFGEDNIGLFDDEDVRGTYYNGKKTKFFKKLTPKILSESFHYNISLETSSKSVQLGQSKFFGRPHFPKDFKSDFDLKNLKFWFQINFKDLKKYDKLDLFPSEGLLSIFTVENQSICKIFFFKDSLNNLAIQEHIVPLNDNDEELINFEPYFVFYVGSDEYDYTEIIEILPEDLINKLKKLLECELASSDTTSRLLGRPIYWQGEDEDQEEDEEEAVEENDDIIFLNSEIDDVSIQLWTSKSDLKNQQFNKMWMIGSGT